MNSARTPADVWSRVDPAMRKPLMGFIAVLRDAFADELDAVTLFGPVVTGGFDPAAHVARSAVVVGRIDLGALRGLACHAARFGKSGIAAPLIMTPGYIRASLDSFPLEMIEIAQQGATVVGENRFENLPLEIAHVRLQCERELKSAMIALRRGVLATAGVEKHLAAIEREAADQLLRTMRGLLWLKGAKDFVPPGDLMSEIERLGQRKLPGLRFALRPDHAPNWADFDALHADVEALMEIVDAW